MLLKKTLPEKAKDSKPKALFLSRREFLITSFVATGGFGLLLTGCSSSELQTVTPTQTTLEKHLDVIDTWIHSLNNEDINVFEQLHTDDVIAYLANSTDSYTGLAHLWDAYRRSTGVQIEKITAFGQDQSVCLLVNATRLNRSQCYVFDLSDGLIERIYEYESGSYNLASSPHFSGIEILGDDSGLQDRLDAMDKMFVDNVNNRDFSEQALTESSIWFGPVSAEPTVGFWESDAQGNVAYVRKFPRVHHKKIQTFGQGDLICCHVSIEYVSKGSLCFVGVFKNGKIAELYEFWSNAQPND